MNEQELLDKMIEALRCYYSPFVMAKDSIDLTFLKTIGYLGGNILNLNQKMIDDFNSKLSYLDKEDGICFPFTIRLFDTKYKWYIAIVGEPSKDKWYEKGLLLIKDKVSSFNISDFKRPETH